MMSSNAIMRVTSGLAVLLVAAGGATNVAAGHSHDDEVLGCGKAHALAQRYHAEEFAAARQAEYERQVRAGLREAFEDTDLLHVDLEIEVIPSQYDNLAGTCSLTVQSKSPALTQFTFRLRSQYTITSAEIGGIPVSVSTQSTTTRVVTLDRTYFMDEVFTLTVAYFGHAESRGFGSIEFTTHAGEDIVYTLSEAYFSYTWWPAKDGDFGEPGDNSDKFTLDLAVIAPSTMVTASNGLLEGVDALSGSRSRYRWSTDYPIAPYLVCFSSTNYNTWTETYVPLAGGTMPVLFYIYPESDTPTNRAAWSEVVQMLYTLRDLYGEYPFVNEKYGIYECEFGGGMEHQTFTAQGTFSERVTAHELGHQWWGDAVTCKTWNHIWLNEGFATYTEALWEEFKPGSSGLPALKAAMASKKYTGGGTVYVSDTEVASMYDIFDGNTSYDKGGWVMHMLRHVLGDADFFATLAAYRAAFEDSAATTDDFQAVCESFYGGSLDWFFQEWVYGEYTPSYAYGWTSTNVAGQDYLLLYVDQVQSSSYQRFTMPIDIVVNGQAHVVFNDNDPEHFVIPISGPASSVQFDPDEWILRGSASSTSYVAGPPVIVASAPAPGETLTTDVAPSEVSVTFHTPVSTAAGDYTLVGDSAGAIPVTFAYDSGSNTATLTTAAALGADTYTLTVADAVTANNSGQALDGEVADNLPSGDGVAGGDATIQFTIEALYAAGDMNCDGAVDFGDINAFVLALVEGEVSYDAAFPDCDYQNADVSGNGSVGFDDINPFVALLVSP